MKKTTQIIVFCLFFIVSFDLRSLSVTYAFDQDTFWKSFDCKDNLFEKLIKKYIPDAYQVKMHDSPDVLICGVYGENIGLKKPIKYRSFLPEKTRIVCYSVESRLIKNNGDYNHVFSFVREFSEDNTFLPNWLYRTLDAYYRKDLTYFNALTTENRTPRNKKNKFCVFVHSHGSHFRDTFFKLLSKKYNQVDSAGKHLNNIGQKIPSGFNQKIDFQKDYLFSLSMENRSKPNYCTEKLLDSFASGCIPIYYGDPHVHKDFNKNAFIRVGKQSDLNKVITIISRINNYPEKQNSYYTGYVASEFIRSLLTSKQTNYEKRIVSMITGINLGHQKVEYKSNYDK